MRTLRNALLAILTLLVVLATALPASASATSGYTVQYTSSPTNGNSGVWVVAGGTTTIYPGGIRGSVTRMTLKPGQYVEWRYTGSPYLHSTQNHSTTSTLSLTVTANTTISGSSFY
jgi:hypothetical protein